MSWDEYTRAVLRIDLVDGAVQVSPTQAGTCDGQFPNVPNQVVYVVTAFNPGGNISSASVNEDGHAALIGWLAADGIAYWEAAGGDPEWNYSEASFALIGVDEGYAKALGRAFGQEVVFEWTPSQLSVLACDGTRRSSAGWTMSPVPADAAVLSNAVALLGLPNEYVTLPTAKAAMQRTLKESSFEQHTFITDAYRTVEEEFWRRLRVGQVRQAEREADALKAKQVQSEKRAQDRAEKRRAASELRQAATDWGWPAKWPMGSFERWQRLERKGHDAKKWAEFGWRPADLKRLTSRDLPAPPPGKAMVWRGIGADGYAAISLTALGLDVGMLDHCCDNIRRDDSLADWILAGEDPTSRVAWTTHSIPRGLAQVAESCGMSTRDIGASGLLGLVGQLLLPSRDPKARERALAFRTFPQTWVDEGGYFDHLSSASGTIATVETDKVGVALSRGKECIELVFKGEVLQLLSVDLPALPIILDVLGLLEESTAAASGSWSAGDLATLLCPPLDELNIDDAHWHLRRDVPVPEIFEIPESIQLASNYWELVGGSQSPASDDDGTHYLLKVGPRHVVVTSEEISVLDEGTDQDAIQVFLRNFVSDEREDLIQETWVRPDIDPRLDPVTKGSST